MSSFQRAAPGLACMLLPHTGCSIYGGSKLLYPEVFLGHLLILHRGHRGQQVAASRHCRESNPISQQWLPAILHNMASANVPTCSSGGVILYACNQAQCISPCKSC